MSLLLAIWSRSVLDLFQNYQNYNWLELVETIFTALCSQDAAVWNRLPQLCLQRVTEQTVFSALWNERTINHERQLFILLVLLYTSCVCNCQWNWKATSPSLSLCVGNAPLTGLFSVMNQKSPYTLWTGEAQQSCHHHHHHRHHQPAKLLCV